MNASSVYRQWLRAVIDANVLANSQVVDILLRIAEVVRLFLPLWSDQILEETRRTHVVKLGWLQRRVKSFRPALEKCFPYSFVSGYERWIAQCTNDEGDRHVLACAIQGRAQHIITFNTRHFKHKDLARWDIEAVKPEDYLLSLHERDSVAVREQIYVASVEREISEADVLHGLMRDCPKFAGRLLSELR